MESSSPPLTPIRQYMTPLDTSPTSSYRESLRRRTSSFSSNHDRSPITPRKHRFSNASQLSHDLPTPGEEGGGGLGNLADELDQLDEDDYEEDLPDSTRSSIPEIEGREPRDSGIDVTYSPRPSSQQRAANFSKPFGMAKKPPDEEREEKLSPDLEDAMSSIARMTSYTSSSEDPLVRRTVALLQDLGNQSNLEAGVQRLTTSTNSMTSHLTAQGKTLQSLSTSLYSPFVAFAAILDSQTVEETTPLIEELLNSLPLPDPLPLQGLQKLDRETANVIQTLSQLTDTLQMGKQITNTAARHLRTTQTMVVDLRLERERADLARHELAKGNVGDRLKARHCAGECKEIVAGFEQVCDALRTSLEHDIVGAA
ncbi:hypothetical protein LTR78_004795 [Recurvomyces mirabilis]|uniref:Uncharacterized protein n=1 Tax=Recurvomyces mirabilis TaxID=574656 RepID=A0AAE0WNW5_9PEZI|nr:hypothetical protein LTR78_004795 [Recurvomyces mirabilis]KAK5157966.1 hypothetical protein LTS14_003889 [Recurvomyces mirabilis]